MCNAATPLTAWEPTAAMWAMRTRFSPFSSISEQARFFWLSSGHFASHSAMTCTLMSKMIWRWRGSTRSKSGTPHFSSASGSSVWFV